ncbi:glutaredoxin family protein [Sideroxydans sp. CL21]|uniref:glutaredoxin family protein n=1 Tax=Sideroxydans sp. CL21 TaxID=2600596 RepID=UPI0024BCAF7A|nr:glutaredoxin family protein [Sideroxydans sp. CL21]
MRNAFLLICLAMLANVQAADLYRSIDKDGKVHYSDSPLMGSEDVEKLKLDSEPVPDESLPYETRIAMQNFPVTLYSFPDCGSICAEARDLLNKRGIPFTEKSLVKKEDIDAFHLASGNSLLPAATIGKTWLKGFLAEQWNNELDIAGYPKSAPPTYRPRPAASAVQPAQ